jgi:hypothetical protein
MHNVDDFHAAPGCLIEDQPILEALDGPTAEASRGRPLEATQPSHAWHADHVVTTSHEVVEKALGNISARLFLQVFELSVDFPPSARANG